MRNTGVQFRGEKQTIRAYEMNGMAPWCIMWTPKDPMCKYEGEDLGEGANLLRQWFKMVREGGTEATYTLRCYDDLKRGEKITNTTPYSASFQFGLFDPQGEIGGVQSPYEQRTSGVLNKIDERFAMMQDKYLDRIVKKMDDEDKEKKESAPSGMAAVIGAITDNPAIMGALVSKLCGFLGINIPAQAALAPAAVSGVGGALTDDQWAKVDQAVNELAEFDSELGDHLLSLAKLAKEKPAKYRMALTFL